MGLNTSIFLEVLKPILGVLRPTLGVLRPIGAMLRAILWECWSHFVGVVPQGVINTGSD